MTNWNKRPIEERDRLTAEIRRLNREGESTNAICNKLGIGHTTVHSILDPTFMERRNEASRARRAAKRSASSAPEVPARGKQAPILLFGEDPRSLTARFMGDPPPGRSARERKGTDLPGADYDAGEEASP